MNSKFFNTLQAITVVTVGASLGLLAGCRAQPPAAAKVNPSEATPAVSEKERPGTSQPNDLAPATAQARIDEIKLGSTTGADGAVANEDDDIVPGETVHLSMQVGDTPAGSAIKVVWSGPNDARIGDEIKTVNAGERFAKFHRATNGWAEGDYKVDIFLGDEKVGTEAFEIKKSS
jgi:hypothetical protein